MNRFLFIALGAALGANARYWVTLWAANRFGTDYPYGTLLVNVTGSFLLGLLLALERKRRRRAVVIDADRHVLGIITDGDLLRRTRREHQAGLLERLRALVSGGRPDENGALLNAHETAADLMTTPVITVKLDDPPAAALQLMVTHQVKRLPVVDGEGRLVGLLGRSSLLRGLLEDGNGQPSP